MNLTGAKAALTKNRVGLGVLGAAAVAALAWRARSKSASGATSSATTPLAATTAPAGYAAGGQTASATGYDSTASDIYNAIQPQLEALSAKMANTTAPPIPVPAAPDYGQGFFRRAGQRAVYQLHNTGALEWVSAPAWAALGNPSVTDLTPGNSLWSAPLVGADAPADQR